MAQGTKTSSPSAAMKGMRLFFASTSRPCRERERKNPLPPVIAMASTTMKSPGMTIRAFRRAIALSEPNPSVSKVPAKKLAMHSVATTPGIACARPAVHAVHRLGTARRLNKCGCAMADDG
jgi:hypothetical protein